jgi:hypothetical protein
MQIKVSKGNRGVLVTASLAVSPAPAVAPLACDEAGERIVRVLAQAAQRVSDILLVATQDVHREGITAALLAAQLPVVRVEVGDVAPTLQARAFLAYPAGDDRVVSDEQNAAADELVAAYAAAHAAQE